MNWVKNNSTSVVWMTSAVFFGVLMQSSLGMVEMLGSGAVALAFSAYLSLYLYSGEPGMAALKRLVPAVVVGVMAAIAWYLGFVFPAYVMGGLYAGAVSLWVAAVFSSLMKKTK